MFEDAWILARKDLKLYFRDRTALLLSLALPIFLATIFGSAMSAMGGGGGMGRVRVLVEDRDGSESSAALVRRLEGAKALHVSLVGDGESARESVADGDVPAGVVIPEGYGAEGERPKLALLRDPAKHIEQRIIAGSLAQTLMGGGDFDFEARLPELLGIEVEDVVGGEDPKRTLAGRSHAISGIAVMMLLFSVAAAGGTLLEERMDGTLERLQLTPGSGSAIMLGKLLSVAAAAVMQLVILFVYGWLVFGVPVFADPLALGLASAGLVFAATGLGLLLAVTCRTRKQLEGISTLVILVMSALGGSWFPLIATPEWFQTLGHFTLNAWAMDAYQGVLWYGKDSAGIALEVTVLMAIGAVLTALTFRGYRRRFEART